MWIALVGHDLATGRFTVHELPTTAVIGPYASDRGER